MKLTRVERWLLSNQCRILELLDPDEALGYAQHREALECGYELNYGWACEGIYSDTMSREECKEVIDILQMFVDLQRANERLEGTSQLARRDIVFSGFDGNNETKHMAYARYFCGLDGGRFPQLERNKDDLNSHAPMLDRYRRMLEEWRASEDSNELTGEDIVRIVHAK